MYAEHDVSFSLRPLAVAVLLSVVPTQLVSGPLGQRAHVWDLCRLLWSVFHHLFIHTSDGAGFGRFAFFGGPFPFGAPGLLRGRVGLTSPGSKTSSGRLMLLIVN